MLKGGPVVSFVCQRFVVVKGLDTKGKKVAMKSQ